MKHLISFILGLITLAIFSCSQEKKTYKEFELNVDVERIINNYINEHPLFNTFILESTTGIKRDNYEIAKDGFLLGPGYESILKKKHLSLHFTVSDKRIFYLSEIDKLIKTDENSWVIKNETDSIIFFNDWIIKDSWSLFIHRAIYFYYNESNVLEVNFRPDTIFAPKLLDSSVKFENIEK
jgi:hypothetical protein